MAGQPVTFSPNEFIVSKTDTRGIITYANDVFLRVADYTLDEVIGKPHNMIRHSSMPRAIFELLWQQIKSGKEIFAYVVNRTKHDDYYWVFAHVTPSFNKNGEIIGYHSNRRAPRPEAIAAVEPLYKELRNIETGAADKKTGLELSSARLREWIEQNGENYDAIILSI